MEIKLFKCYLFYYIIMNTNFLINDYIENNTNIDDLKNELYKNGVMSKYYEDENLLLVYTKHNNVLNINELSNECRSLVIDTNTNKIVSYTCNTPIVNMEAMNYLLEHNDDNKKIYKCYEGSLLSLFNNNGKWYLSTRRCLDSNDSVWKEDSHYNLFLDVLREDGFNSLDDFVQICNPDYCYYFVLLHHQNKLIIDYSDEFGENYKKLCLAIVREQETQNEILFNNLDDVFTGESEYGNIFGNIFIPQEYEDLEIFNSMNDDMNSYLHCKNEGIVIKMLDGSCNTILKLQTLSYQFNRAIGSENNILKGLILLYQNNKLDVCFENNNELENFRKIINPFNTHKTYDTIGVIDSLFKVLTSETYELYKILFNLKTGKQMNNEIASQLYKLLPSEYKSILYNIRGIYYKNKKKSIDNNSDNKIYLHIKNIYEYYKNKDIETIVELLRVRKLMYNWLKLENKPGLKLFGSINKKCERIHLNLIDIFTNKLFPNIMPSDIPN